MKLINYPFEFNFSTILNNSNKDDELLLYAVIIHRVI